MNAATILAFFMNGLHEAGYMKFAEIMAKHGMGHIDMVAELNRYAEYLEALAETAETILTEGFPGVLEYEVAEPFGAWYASQTIKNDEPPRTEDAEKYLLEDVTTFLCQGEDTRVSIPLKALLETVTMDFSRAKVQKAVLASLVEMANSHIEDIESGLEDGTYDKADNGDLPAKQMAVKIAEAMLKGTLSTTTETSVPVKHWSAYEVDGTVLTHQIDIDDQRATSGQAYVTVGALEGPLDEMLCVAMQVETNPLDGMTHVPAAHVYFDGDNVAVRLFKIGENILVHPETPGSVEGFQHTFNGRSERLYWIK